MTYTEVPKPTLEAEPGQAPPKWFLGRTVYVLISRPGNKNSKSLIFSSPSASHWTPPSSWTQRGIGGGGRRPERGSSFGREDLRFALKFASPRLAKETLPPRVSLNLARPHGDPGFTEARETPFLLLAAFQSNLISSPFSFFTSKIEERGS